jgi:hypothetical protein
MPKPVKSYLPCRPPFICENEFHYRYIGKKNFASCNAGRYRKIFPGNGLERTKKKPRIRKDAGFGEITAARCSFAEGALKSGVEREQESGQKLMLSTCIVFVIGSRNALFSRIFMPPI